METAREYKVMKVAIAESQGFVSPVLDFAKQVLIVEVDGNEIKRQESVSCAQCSGGAMPAFFNTHGANVIICGAVSKPLWELIKLQGIDIVPYIRGDVKSVIDAFVSGNLLTAQFRMSGCWPGARRGLGKCMCRRRFGKAKGTR